MKLTDLILEKCLVRVLEGKKTDTVISETASLIDKYLDERFDGKSEELQRVLVNEVLLPLCGELMREHLSQLMVDIDIFRQEIVKRAIKGNDYV